MNKKPLIGVLPLVDSARECFWMLPGYFEGIAAAGGIPAMLPLTSDEAALAQIAEDFDGFLFTGGHDVSPELYGAPCGNACEECCAARDAMETRLFALVRALDKPAFGICRGIQFFNAALGGTLFQDLPTEHPSGVTHRQKPPYDAPAHAADIVPESALCRLFGGATRVPVNSRHHQAIRKVAPALEVMAVSEDGLVEAVRMPQKRFVWAVQWHPESSFRSDAHSLALFQIFVEECAESAAERAGTNA